MSVLHAACILMEAHIQLPMQVVLDPPVVAQCRRITPRRHAPTADEVNNLRRLLPVDRPFSAAHPHRPQVRPGGAISNAAEVLDDHATAFLHTPMPLFLRRALPTPTR